jgi:hypothetical protein
MKKALKKLALSRETLLGLSSSSLRNVRAGAEVEAAGTSEGSWCYTCESCTGICCNSMTYKCP